MNARAKSEEGSGERMSDEFDLDELSFDSSIPATGADAKDRKGPKGKGPTAKDRKGPKEAGAPRKPRLASLRLRERRGRRWRRRFAGAMTLLVALVGVGGAYTFFADSSGADDTTTSQADVAAGRNLYNVSCITCHGANLQGVKDRGPSLIGVGSAAVYFQVSTGRMPAPAQGGDVKRKTAKFTEEQINQLGAYIESIAPGPQTPHGNLRVGDDKLGLGGDLFRLNCASCHGSTGKGAPLSAGKSAPGLRSATDKQIYTAMLSGPESMPVFNDNQLTPDQKKAILTYIQKLEAQADPGGNGLDRIGPVSEGLVIWILGIGAMMVVILWIGAKT